MQLLIYAPLTVFLCFLSVLVTAKNIDSLKKQIRLAGSDKASSEILLETGRAYLSVDNDSAFFYLTKALRLGQKIKNTDVCFSASRILGNLEKEVYYDMQAALKYHVMSLGYANEQNVEKNIATLRLSLSGDYLQLGDASQVISYADSALQTVTLINDTPLICKAYDLMGVGYTLLEDFPNALDVLGRAIALYEARKDKPGVGREYSIIATIFNKQKKYPQALEYYKKANDLLVAARDTAYITQNDVNMGLCYQEMGDYKQAIQLFKATLAITEQGDVFWVVTSLNLATALSKNGAYAEAENDFSAIEKLFREGLKNPVIESSVYSEHAAAYVRTKEYDKALAYAKKNETLLHTYAAAIEDKADNALQLSDIYSKTGNMTAAFEYHKKYSDFKDSIAASAQTRSYAQAEAKFHLSERDNTIKQLSKENELHKELTRKNRIINISLIAMLILGLVFTFGVIGAYRRTLKRNALLSEQKQALQLQKEIIDQQVVKLDNAAAMKSKFLANISHELRTPVTLLTGMLELMSDKRQPDDAKERERLNVAYNNSRKLQHMVEEILDLTKLENNVAQPVYETKEIAPLLRRVVYTFETLIGRQHLSLEYEDIKAQGLFVSVDKGKFEKIINNLVYNAVKFNKAGGKIVVTAYPLADNKHVCIDVTDSGIGIAAEDVPHIFEHFYQGRSAGIKADGAGIGLSLVKEFTLLMGGTVDVKSKKDEGTTFTLRFPLIELSGSAEIQPVETIETPTEQWGNFARRQVVLVVEDNAEMRYYLKEVLGEKVNIANAGNGKEALAWLEHNLPDLIISDVMMPGMDGRELVTYLKNDDRYKKIPVITLTALADTESQLSFLRLGVDDYIVKPFNADELRIRVYNLLTNNAVRKAFNEQPPEPDDIKQDSAEAETFRQKVTEYVLARLKSTNVSVFDLANELALSERQLYRLCNSLTGYTPAQLIKEVRLQKAYELLLSGDINKIDDVCKRVGFEKTSYFSQQFLDRFGKRPTEFL